MNVDPDEMPVPESAGGMKPPKPPYSPVKGAADADGDDGSIRISLPPKAKETVRIAIPKESPAG
jgi:hypothetical protein